MILYNIESTSINITAKRKMLQLFSKNIKIFQGIHPETYLNNTQLLANRKTQPHLRSANIRSSQMTTSRCIKKLPGNKLPGVF